MPYEKYQPRGDYEHEARLNQFLYGDGIEEIEFSALSLGGSGSADAAWEAHLQMVLDSLGTDHQIELMPHPRDIARKEADERARQMDAAEDAAYIYQHQTRVEGNITFDLLPRGTAPNRGDEVCEEGVWRPRRTLAMCESAYDRAFLKCQKAQRVYEAMLDKHGEASPLTRNAKLIFNAAVVDRSKALKAADDPVVQERDRVDLWRKENPKDYNTSRRKVRDKPNDDLSGMTPEEKKAHRNAQKAARKREARAKEKAEKAKAVK